MNKQLIFFCPNILNDGLKTTQSIFYDLKNNFKHITIIVISHDTEILKFADAIIEI